MSLFELALLLHFLKVIRYCYDNNFEFVIFLHIKNRGNLDISQLSKMHVHTYLNNNDVLRNVKKVALNRLRGRNPKLKHFPRVNSPFVTLTNIMN